MRARVREKMLDAKGKALTPPIQFTRQERWLIVGVMRNSMKACTNPFAMPIYNSLLKKLEMPE